MWCEGGINRFPARAAFAQELPEEILQRSYKPGPDSFLRDIFTCHRPAIRSHLMDGLLASQGVLDCSALERALAVDPLSDDSVIHRLLDLMEAENWAQSWVDKTA